MEQRGKLRDAQLEAIKTYLYLKIACHNLPLWLLMYEGRFNSMEACDLDEMSLKTSSRAFLKSHPEALALYEYAASQDDNGICTSACLADIIKRNPADIDYKSIIKSLFYGVEYTDYLFSIPMGAGKTWLMAAFVYLNLYFALNEPDNPVFAHNFIVLAPAGLKSSIIPSLKDMQEFDPSFVLPEQVAEQIKYRLKYEILEEDNSAKSSNQIKNPNALKIQMHQPFDGLQGLVVITNAEKLYDRIDHSIDSAPDFACLLDEKDKTDWLKTVRANELRQIIAKIPNLCIMIDEVHHASEEQLLRRVVEKWVAENTFNSVLGFSGTPYLSSPEKIHISEELTLKNSMLANVVTYYPLVRAVGNFLKMPTIRTSDISMEDIVRNGLEDFFSKYQDTFYPNVGFAKIAIYCGRIDTLETEIAPLAISVCQKYGLDPNESILKFYRKSKGSAASCTPDAEARFRALDSVFSKVRIVLLVQIGKEGWNCKSLTSVILPSENSSPKNMVLQTSCRCLREVVDARREHALIWLNEFNERKLDEQLKKEHHTSVSEIQKSHPGKNPVRRFSRQSVVNLPKLSYVQLHFSCSVVSTEDNNISERLHRLSPAEIIRSTIKEKDLAGTERITGQSENRDIIQPMEYIHWINLIAKESFYTISANDLKKYDAELRRLFNSASILNKNSIRILNPDIEQQRLRSDIRKCFSAKSKIEYSKEIIPRQAALLKVEKISEPYFASPDTILCPSENEVLDIIDADNHKEIPDEILAAIHSLEEQGMHSAAEALRAPYADRAADAINLRTYQYLPYSFDSGLENKYYLNIIRSLLATHQRIEAYFNGDESLTEFYIDCYKFDGAFWRSIGKYYPDFVLLKRNDSGDISKVVLAETKGTVYESSFKEKKDFMNEFIAVNNVKGPTKFDFLYIPESMPDNEQYQSTLKRISEFLNS